MLSADSTIVCEEAEDEGEEDEEAANGAENTISDKILIVWDPPIFNLW